MLSMLALGSEKLMMGNNFPGSGVCFVYTDFGIPEYYRIIVLGLIALVGIKEMLLTSRKEDHFSIDSIDIGIFPLLICFVANFLFAGLEIIFTGLSP
ncbi:hypothetical protein DU80_10095 [Methanosarcina mazei]|uniref:Uncharacterized protein n=9 Tax=Methanosarcina TaxID=2207 RepID=A0A0F8MA87_METMZ|nr:hypothetical protein MM_1131 [Methanosarcina mazei Go1]AGF96566.1 hypothetical protein MmTuc01_1177 [Methanosarcina mazei Tuc01]AKB39170.1 hypothetical protein MSMAW_0179 [Methanosarcina mazei WWM610]AKB60165.1 hypothetical protein MSMAP_0180 [Methanosarcina mazei SarPi]AKB63369.1 hypothetical protein MSMAS_0173 [Methanosarcina mazei S-6]AKB66716.1 hypothetical protein MSMAL_0173 [Methanosarcina mazei LYC]AKB70068.1 hypothetical protein MSMAC_0178 [Methanosarcina mazei C16]KKF98571.1 hypo